MKQEMITQRILEEAKKYIRAFVFDFDGTLISSSEPDFGENEVIDLIERIGRSNKYPAVISARGATIFRMFEEKLLKLTSANGFAVPIFLGCGNGTTLYKFKKGEKEVIYNQGLNVEEIKRIVKVWARVFRRLHLKLEDLSPKGLETFRRFLQEDWSDYIPSNVVNLCMPFDGSIFTEEQKVSVVLPSDKMRHKEYIDALERAINEDTEKTGFPRFQVKRGDVLFAHITHTFDVDPKLFALNKIIEELKLSKNQLAVFGDMPIDNDKGLLVESNFPFAFTNATDFEKSDINKPPFILPQAKNNKIKSVHEAINYLISKI